MFLFNHDEAAGGTTDARIDARQTDRRCFFRRVRCRKKDAEGFILLWQLIRAGS
jgi:hypothetical protein